MWNINIVNIETIVKVDKIKWHQVKSMVKKIDNLSLIWFLLVEETKKKTQSLTIMTYQCFFFILFISLFIALDCYFLILSNMDTRFIMISANFLFLSHFNHINIDKYFLLVLYWWLLQLYDYYFYYNNYYYYIANVVDRVEKNCFSSLRSLFQSSIIARELLSNTII